MRKGNLKRLNLLHLLVVCLIRLREFAPSSYCTVPYVVCLQNPSFPCQILWRDKPLS